MTSPGRVVDIRDWREAIHQDLTPACKPDPAMPRLLAALHERLPISPQIEPSLGGSLRYFAVVYVYFLIFAQFAFLARLAEAGIRGNALKLVMAFMAAGGILLSLVTPRMRTVQNPALRLRLGLVLSAALGTLAPLQLITAAFVALLIGAGLGITTVKLVTHLRAWTSSAHLCSTR